MGGFFYFVQTDDESQLDADALGLAHAVRGPVSVLARRQVQGFRDGERSLSGWLVWSGSEDRLYKPEQQRWRRMPRLGKEPPRWVGCEADDPPTPESLQRKDCFVGGAPVLDHYDFQDAAGRSWSVPRIGAVDEGDERACGLPRCVDLDERGRVVMGEVVARYAELWGRSDAWWAKLAAEEIYDPTEAFCDASEVLGSLYHVSPTELAAMGVFSEEAVHSAEHVVAVAMSYYRWRAVQEAKKKDPLSRSPTASTSPTGGGQAASA